MWDSAQNTALDKRGVKGISAFIVFNISIETEADGLKLLKLSLFNFSEIFTILLWHINNSNSAKKSKKYFLRQKFEKKSLY